jgi:regulator of sigma E protease
LGGFVNILGDGDPSKEEEEQVKKADPKGNLKNKSKWAQAFVMLAGIFMNILLAIFCYFLVLGFSNWKIALSYEFSDFNPVGAQITRERESDVPYRVIEESFAAQSGMPTEGYITNIENTKVEYIEDIRELIGDNSEVNIRACNTEGKDCGDDGKIGVAIGANYFVYIDYSNHKILSGPSHFINNIRLIGRVFGSLFREARETGDYSTLSQSVSGPVGIFFLVDYFRTLGWIPFISLIADLSLSLAIMNILPIPALDGGRVLIVAIEGVLHKDLDPKVESIIINISFILLMVFIVFVMIKDIVNIDELKSLFE